MHKLGAARVQHREPAERLQSSSAGAVGRRLHSPLTPAPVSVYYSFHFTAHARPSLGFLFPSLSFFFLFFFLLFSVLFTPASAHALLSHTRHAGARRTRQSTLAEEKRTPSSPQRTSSSPPVTETYRPRSSSNSKLERVRGNSRTRLADQPAVTIRRPLPYSVLHAYSGVQVYI